MCHGVGVSPVSRGRRRKSGKKRARPVRPSAAGADVVHLHPAGQHGGSDGSAELEELGGFEDFDEFTDRLIADVIDTVEPEDLPDLLARRLFVTPTDRALVDGEELRLDPADPDERALLIRTEHPEYAQALADPLSDVTVDGVNPRLHISMHEIVANQLWNDDPPGAWAAAKRALEAGHERHDVLHALADVATRHVWFALHEGRPHDPVAYDRDLAAIEPEPVSRRERREARRSGGGARPRTGSPDVLRLTVTLRSVDPPVWRRVDVPGSLTLADLHDVLQVAMGWEDCHPHRFVAGKREYGPPDPDDPSGGRTADEAGVLLRAVLRRPGNALVYEYDFGDGWEHDVVLDEVRSGTGGAVCVDGERACPPEDCGGAWGYAQLCAAVADPSHPDAADLREWVGPDFDPERFDRDAVNRVLAALRLA